MFPVVRPDGWPRQVLAHRLSLMGCVSWAVSHGRNPGRLSWCVRDCVSIASSNQFYAPTGSLCYD